MCVTVCVFVLPFVAQSFMCVAHNNGGFSLFDVNFLFLLLLSQLLLVLFLHLSLLERATGDGEVDRDWRACPLRTLKFDKLMFALILCCNYFNNLHPAPTVPTSPLLLLLTTGGTRWAKSVFQIARPNSWQTVAMSPPLPVRRRGRGTRRRGEAPKLRKLFVRAERSPNNNQVLIILRSSKVKVSSCSHRKSSFEIRIDLAARQLWQQLWQLQAKQCLSMVRQLLISFCQL